MNGNSLKYQSYRLSRDWFSPPAFDKCVSRARVELNCQTTSFGCCLFASFFTCCISPTLRTYVVERQRWSNTTTREYHYTLQASIRDWLVTLHQDYNKTFAILRREWCRATQYVHMLSFSTQGRRGRNYEKQRLPDLNFSVWKYSFSKVTHLKNYYPSDNFFGHSSSTIALRSTSCDINGSILFFRNLSFFNRMTTSWDAFLLSSGMYERNFDYLSISRCTLKHTHTHVHT